MNVRGYHEVVAGLDQFCGEVITKCLCSYTKCSCKVMKMSNKISPESTKP